MHVGYSGQHGAQQQRLEATQVSIKTGLWAGGSQGQEFKTSLAKMVKPVSAKNTKISQEWWCMPVVPATQEAEARRIA